MKKGISLIVLVITIIVMIIIAGVIIVSLTSSNIVNKANKAVENTNDSVIREQIDIAMTNYKTGQKATLKESLEQINGAIVEETTNANRAVYVAMNNMEYTVYSDGKIKKGKHIMWTGNIATGFASGSGTESTPYIIETPEQLAYLAQQVNAGVRYEGSYFRLENNLDLTAVKDKNGNWSSEFEWNSIGYTTWEDIDDYKFAGIFDGNNKAVSGIYMIEQSGKMGQALFGMNIGTVKNLGVEDSYISGYKDIGAIVGGNEGIVENCYNKDGEIRSDYYTGSPNLGGVVGYNGGTVRNCYNTGDITSTKNTSNGGTAGVVGANTNLIENCYNTGKIIGIRSTGGVVGYSQQSDGNPLPKIINCYNTGNVTGKGSGVGGVIGTTSNGQILNCYNTGNIVTNIQSVGGILGISNTTVLVQNCYNKGQVNSTYTSGDNTTGYMSGGIVGRNLGTIDNCYNAGNIKNERIVTGGIAGQSTGTISNCYNIGNVDSAKSESGGIVGRNENIVKNCWNSGNITSGTAVAGGIVGNNFVANSLVENSYNIGTIKANTQIAGGIVGANYTAGATVKYSYNKGTVTVPTSEGGVVGKTIVAETIITKCYYLTGTNLRGLGTNVSVDGVDQAGIIEATTDNISNYNSFLSWITNK